MGWVQELPVVAKMQAGTTSVFPGKWPFGAWLNPAAGVVKIQEYAGLFHGESGGLGAVFPVALRLIM